MASRFQSRGWRRCRTAFRWVRITILFLLLLIVSTGAYLNLVGLPDPLKARLLKELHARGFDLQFTRVRLRYYQGIVAENVRFGPAEAKTNGPSLSAREVEVKINREALRHFEFTPESLIIHAGDLEWPLAETNRSPRKLSLNHLETRVRFLTNDQVQLDHFTASFAGADFHLAGAVTNASAIRDWKVFQTGAEAAPPNVQNRLTKLADTLERLKFQDAPQVSLILHGDGRDPKSFDGRFRMATQGAETPWGTLTNGHLVVELLPPNATNRQPHAEFNLRADNADTRWGSTRGFKLEARAIVDAAETNLVRCNLKLQADEFRTEWANATNAQATVVWTHALTNAIPLDGHGELRLADVRTRWGQAGELRLDTSLDTPATNNLSNPNPDWAWWADLKPYALDWNCRLRDIHAKEFKVREVGCAGTWRAPDLIITNLHSELYQGELNFQAAVDVATRALTFKSFFDFDVHSIETLLPAGARNWLKDYSWARPPTVYGDGGLTLPAWTNREPDWEGEVGPTLWLKGGFQCGPATYCTVPVLSCNSQILYSNQVWNLPDLVATRPEGRVLLQHIADDKVHKYYFRIQSDIDVQALRPLSFLTNKTEVEVMDMLSFTKPPVVDLELWGHWHVLEETGIKAHIEATNFIFRGESASHFQTDLEYTNRLLNFVHPRVERGARFATVDRMVLNFDQQNLFLTNGFSTMEPSAIIHPIGPVVTRTLEPYQFLQPPTVHANGFIPLVDGVPADAHFHLEGGPFHWQRFNVTNISGDVHWVGDHLRLSEMKSEFYGGHMTGSAAFDFTSGPGTEFSFDTIVTEVDLAALVKDVFGPSNHLEGQLNGHLIIDKANTDVPRSWFGHGQADLHNGLLWQIPVFGGVSGLLNQIHPGLGESRASDASGTFIITNSVISSTDLEVRGTKMRLRYNGTCDFDGRVDTDATAQVLRDAPGVGALISAALTPFEKAFECKVTGTLGQPKIELKWLAVRLLTKPIDWILHPFSTLKGLVPTQPSNPVFPTDAPPAPPTTPPAKPPE